MTTKAYQAKQRTKRRQKERGYHFVELWTPNPDDLKRVAAVQRAHPHAGLREVFERIEEQDDE